MLNSLNTALAVNEVNGAWEDESFRRKQRDSASSKLAVLVAGFKGHLDGFGYGSRGGFGPGGGSGSGGGFGSGSGSGFNGPTDLWGRGDALEVLGSIGGSGSGGGFGSGSGVYACDSSSEFEGEIGYEDMPELEEGTGTLTLTLTLTPPRLVLWLRGNDLQKSNTEINRISACKQV